MLKHKRNQKAIVGEENFETEHVQSTWIPEDGILHGRKWHESYLLILSRDDRQF
jgi:hypothetical protein